jgi:hypothetical protein
MRFDPEKLLEDAKNAIINNNLVFIEEVVHFLPCSKPTFYDYFKVDSNEFNELKELLDKNRVNQKLDLRGKWANSDAPALQLALYKLISSPDEIKALSMQSIDHTTKGESINVISLGNGINPKTDS